MAAAADQSNAVAEQWLKWAQDGKGNLDEMKKLRDGNPKFDIDCADETGMTALMHAAFRGHPTLCEYLIQQGANINSDKHDSQYTPLMFAALSGNEEVVTMILDAGAKIDAVNSVQRTAAEMASFVAQYHIGGIIGNFVPSKELLKFTTAKGQEQRPKLKKELLKPFHKFLCAHNLHPIYIVKQLQANSELVDDSKYLCQILDQLVTEKMNPHNTHESLALKCHYLSCVLKHTADAKAADKKGTLDTFLKRLAKGRDSDGFLVEVENIIRSTLRSYPKPESQLFQMLLKKLSDVEVGSYPPGILALTDSIYGNRMRSAEDSVCDVCGEREPKRCTACSKAFYCSVQCQKIHRPTHKKFCVKSNP